MWCAKRLRVLVWGVFEGGFTIAHARMPPRGLRALVKRTAPGAFSKGKYPCFRLTSSNGRATGPKMRGITKRLAERLFSKSALVSGPGQWRGGAWAGEGGGLRRGKAVDSQVSRLAKLSEAARRGAKMLKLTRLTFAALRYHSLEPVEAQRVVLDASRGLGTAVDVVCTRGADELELPRIGAAEPMAVLESAEDLSARKKAERAEAINRQLKLM